MVMSMVRIGPSRQVTLPADVLEKLDLGAGDALEAEVREGKLVLTPKSAGALAPEERKLLQQAKRKIARIRNDMARSRGLTPAEADIAVRDRKSTRLNSSHVAISYAVFCLKK